MTLTLGELAKRSACDLIGDPDIEVSRADEMDAAGPDSIVFAVDAVRLAEAERSAAAAILTSVTITRVEKPVLRAQNVRLAWSCVLDALYPEPTPTPGIHPSAVVSPTACVAASASIGPLCCVGAQSMIGERCILESGVVIGESAVIGADSRLGSHVVVGERCVIGERNRLLPGAVIGSTGFGFAQDGHRSYRIPQVGIVRTGCDVELGANTTVDRAALGETVIGDGTKIDNQVQIGHNVTIGPDAVIAAQVGISGSVHVGIAVMIGGQAGVADHAVIGDGARLAGRSGVISDVPAGAVVMGYPARPRLEFLRATAALYRLPALIRQMRAAAPTMRSRSEPAGEVADGSTP